LFYLIVGPDIETNHALKLSGRGTICGRNGPDRSPGIDELKVFACHRISLPVAACWESQRLWRISEVCRSAAVESAAHTSVRGDADRIGALARRCSIGWFQFLLRIICGAGMTYKHCNGDQVYAGSSSATSCELSSRQQDTEVHGLHADHKSACQHCSGQLRMGDNVTDMTVYAYYGGVGSTQCRLVAKTS
jgi:hypothetical protein